ncbi:hypothetical protein BpHYR1_038448 [Brachionus plicatilis]|uniref:Uncharacterized protein n=1 Tax=Brachionus plicatilis TaxID=10195 RepID=A0A3M7Q6U8_BRAPC|nr:hypothetical protein BpHYR1_038448 [Brachionus plicatilis]
MASSIPEYVSDDEVEKEDKADCPAQRRVKRSRNSTTPNEVKKSRISDSGEGCFKALGNVLRASSNGLKMSQKKEIQSKKKNYTVQNLKYTISDELEEEEDDHESLLKAN